MISVTRGIWRSILGAVFIVLVFTTYRLSTSSHLYSPLFSTDQPVLVPKPDIIGYKAKPHHQFWADLFVVLNANKPELPSVETAIEYRKDAPKDGVKTKQNLANRATISKETIKELQQKHKQVLNDLPELTKVVYHPETSGIVLVGGGKFSWLAYLSVLSIRDTGCKLPVEVVLPKYDDYEKEIHYCSELLPKLNARCVVVPDVLGPSVMLEWGNKLANYQFKSLALMVSSFQNILLVDADNILVKSPEPLFASQLFKDYGMVTWPDYWERTIAPDFYEVAGVKVDEKTRSRYNRYPMDPKIKLTDEDVDQVPYHDLEGAISDLSSESGQLLINKATHSKTLLLSLYYNIYGPKIYYKLLSLGEQGEGDKDTFPAAAHVAGEKYYQVKSFIKTFGYADLDNKFQGVAMGQKDPLLDYELFQKKAVAPLRGKNMGMQEQVDLLKKVSREDFGEDGLPLFTIHCNYPKLDPLTLMDRDDLYDKEKAVLKYRIYGGLKYKKPTVKDGKLTEIEEDFELQQWKNMKMALCDRKYEFTHFNSKNIDKVCELVKNQVTKLSA